MALKKKELTAAAKEICEVCGLEDDKGGPAIKITGKMKPKDVEKKIQEAFPHIEEDEFDEMTDSTKEVLEELGFEAGESEEIDEEDEEEVDEEEVDEEDEEEVDEEEEVDLVTLVNDTKKLVDLKELVKEHDEFKKLRKGLDKFKGLAGPRELKPLMLKALGIEEEPKEKKGKKSKANKKGKKGKKSSPIVKKEAGNTRYGACALAMQALNKKTVTMAELAEKADEIYQEIAGCESNVKQSKRVFSRYIPFAVVLGLLTEDGKKFKVTV